MKDINKTNNDLRLKWARDSDGHESDLDFLLKFLYKEISRLERSEAFRSKKSSNDGKKESTAAQEVPQEKNFSAAALNTSSKQELPVCSFCSKNHKSEKCFAVLKLDGQERAERMKRLGLCFRCLIQGHTSKDCKIPTKCSKCGGTRHNVLLCGVKLEWSPRQEEKAAPAVAGPSAPRPENVTLMSSEEISSSRTILATAKVNVCAGDGRVIVATLMFDGGCDRSYISSNFVKICNPKWLSSAPISYSSFGGHSGGRNDFRSIFKLNLLDKDNKIFPIITAEIPRICQPLIRPVVSNNVLNDFSHLDLADDYNRVSPLEIDVLIGLDFYWTLISEKDAVRRDCVVALRSVFGYVLSGNFSERAQPRARTCSRAGDRH